ncbi:hypothetical protein KP78_05440 [Jeotgalibacillus soli]|uniref:Uncharacterized protein n=1 Tax=Jeotgalibacillus soli TaxID=889306 RepID=A0A0C2SDZ3_9BACL|nr:hypothetical protein KP78_05440 [Jeotgalibacillus soli]
MIAIEHQKPKRSNMAYEKILVDYTKKDIETPYQYHEYS